MPVPSFFRRKILKSLYSGLIHPENQFKKESVYNSLTHPDILFYHIWVQGLQLKIIFGHFSCPRVGILDFSIFFSFYNEKNH